MALRGFVWVVPWLAGLTLISALGRYGTGSTNVLPDWVDSGVVVIFALVIFFFAGNFALTPEEVQRAIATETERDEHFGLAAQSELDCAASGRLSLRRPASGSG